MLLKKLLLILSKNFYCWPKSVQLFLFCSISVVLKPKQHSVAKCIKMACLYSCSISMTQSRTKFVFESRMAYYYSMLEWNQLNLFCDCDIVCMCMFKWNSCSMSLATFSSFDINQNPCMCPCVGLTQLNTTKHYPHLNDVIYCAPLQPDTLRVPT